MVTRLSFILSLLLLPTVAWAGMKVDPSNCATPPCTAGQAGEMCYQEDTQVFYICDPKTTTWELMATAGLAGHADGADCAAGEIAIGVDAAGAVQGCYEPAEADISDLLHNDVVETIASGLPTCDASADGLLAWVTDAVTDNGCTTGGTKEVLCVCDGDSSNWRGVETFAFDEAVAEVTYYNLDDNGHIGFGAADVPQGSLTAPLASPILSGDPTAPTPAGADSDTSIATTAFVQGEINPLGSSLSSSTNDIVASTSVLRLESSNGQAENIQINLGSTSNNAVISGSAATWDFGSTTISSSAAALLEIRHTSANGTSPPMIASPFLSNSLYRYTNSSGSDVTVDLDNVDTGYHLCIYNDSSDAGEINITIDGSDYVNLAGTLGTIAKGIETTSNGSGDYICLAGSTTTWYTLDSRGTWQATP